MRTKKNHEEPEKEIALCQYWQSGSIVDWVECWWDGSLSGEVNCQLYRATIKHVSWVDHLPIVVLYDIKRYYVQFATWRLVKSPLQKRKFIFNFPLLAHQKASFGFETIPGNRLRFHIQLNVTGVVGQANSLQGYHSFAESSHDESRP
jgi:hypothetical protein